MIIHPYRRLLLPVIVITLALIFIMPAFTQLSSATGTTEGIPDGRKKVLFINSYDMKYDWGQRTVLGALNVFNVSLLPDNTLDDSASPVAFRLYNMDSKNRKTVAEIEAAALEAKRNIDSSKPDVVICADDNASKYLIVPYFSDSDIPFVFCGVNWSAEAYGFPRANVTGMLEVFPIQEAVDILKPYMKGDRVGLLVNDTISERKNAQYIKEIFKLNLVERYVNTMDELVKAYEELQDIADLLIVIEVVHVEGFDEEKLFAVTQNTVNIPSIFFANLRLENFLLTCKRLPEEQGEWAARAALEILDGTSPADIPVAMNHKLAIRLNMQQAKRLGIRFPMEVIERASFVSEDTPP